MKLFKRQVDSQRLIFFVIIGSLLFLALSSIVFSNYLLTQRQIGSTQAAKPVKKDEKAGNLGGKNSIKPTVPATANSASCKNPCGTLCCPANSTCTPLGCKANASSGSTSGGGTGSGVSKTSVGCPVAAPWPCGRLCCPNNTVCTSNGCMAPGTNTSSGSTSNKGAQIDKGENKTVAKGTTRCISVGQSCIKGRVFNDSGSCIADCPSGCDSKRKECSGESVACGQGTTNNCGEGTGSNSTSGSSSNSGSSSSSDSSSGSTTNSDDSQLIPTLTAQDSTITSVPSSSSSQKIAQCNQTCLSAGYTCTEDLVCFMTSTAPGSDVCRNPFCTSKTDCNCTSSTSSNGSTTTPTIISATTKSANATLTLKFRLQGIQSKPTNSESVTALLQVINSQNIIVNSINITLTVNDQGIWQLTTPNQFAIVESDTYSIYVKGYKHLKKKLASNIKLKTGENAFDYSSLTLPAGDLPNPQQDGIINAQDLSFITNNLNNKNADKLKIGDLNLDGSIDTQDYSLMLNSLVIKYDEAI